MKLLVVISLTLTLSHVVVHSARVRRKMTDKEKSDIVNHHNVLREREGASNMEYMTWNESLATAAAELVAQCNWGHAFPPLPGTKITSYGQNLFMVSGEKIDVKKGIQDWYDEKRDYDYEKTLCANDKICGYYTQVVWATSRQVGCAYHYCTAMKNSGFSKAQYLACNYIPGGNFAKEKPYKKGTPCSKCGSGAGWCKDGLCNSQCSKAGKDCTCKAICHNCAKLDREACRCSCADGWSGPDCLERCEDRSEQCNPASDNPGWPPEMCSDHEHGRMVKRNCPVMCKMCKPDPDAEAEKCPPVYAAAESAMSTKSPAGSDDDDDDDNDDNNTKGYNGSQHQQHCSTVELLSHVTLSLTITWKALL